MKIHLPNTSSCYTDPSISPTGGKTRKWQGCDPRHAVKHNMGWFEDYHIGLGTIVVDYNERGKAIARTTGVSELRNGFGRKNDVGEPQGPAIKYMLACVVDKLLE